MIGFVVDEVVEDVDDIQVMSRSVLGDAVNQARSIDIVDRVSKVYGFSESGVIIEGGRVALRDAVGDRESISQIGIDSEG